MQIRHGSALSKASISDSVKWLMQKSSVAAKPATRQVVQIPATVSNRDFLASYAQPGLVGLACGTTVVDRAIARAERHIDGGHCWGQWTHAFVFSERRSDGHLWIVESDLDIGKKRVQFGVQENRSGKYDDHSLYSSLAVLDFNLTEDLIQRVIGGALNLLAERTRYSLRELIGTWIALKRPALRERGNILARDHCFYCSAFVQYLYHQAGIGLTCGLDVKNTTPEDIARSPRPHTAYVLQREILGSRLQHTAERLQRRAGVRWRAVQRRKA
jgi:hypothetical protein